MKLIKLLVVAYIVLSVVGFFMPVPHDKIKRIAEYQRFAWPVIVWIKDVHAVVPYGWGGNLPRVIECVILPWQRLEFRAIVQVPTMHGGYPVIAQGFGELCAGYTTGGW